MNEIGFIITEIEYSKKISKGLSGEIVKKQDKKFFILEYPFFNDKEKKMFTDILKELKETKNHIKNKTDIYFLIKNFCLENFILLRKDQREKISLVLEWETLGNSILEPILKDPDFEEIVINGKNKPIMLYHNVFGWLTSNIYFNSDEKIKTIINKIASPLGRQLSYNNPILNATLSNGSRLNASMDPIAFTGINATIRKFKENPLTPKNIINFDTINEKAMAFLWLVMQTSSSILVCGNTGSGKTTTLNALFCFLPKDERIIVVEETPEIVLPQEHIVKLNTAEHLKIGLDKLIENTFRMRPDRVIVGEIRSKDEAKAFVNTMLAGQARGSYATFHAESAREAIERLSTFGIEKNSLKTLDIILVQKRITRINNKNNIRREERKIVEICEIENSEQITLNTLFELNHLTGKLVKVNESKRLNEKIKQTFCCNEKEYLKLLKEKELILEKINESVSFKEFFELSCGEIT
ncbi:MAG: ATPase, T2SS/T4P/T4SS family [Candidatus ainarchaeum sp.]|nr:ATPase, T2SS/T4P/T4SS family [Candidatus ainarchaeum sp.]